ncbi:hypothetical protein [Nonomuraea basaltis]|uniref:hypothetical protein n=1 Tax=Nonomuraea basaltis TaxID=2495887 RepID=UPI00110C5DB7|nr:hypothetical protein [Nonomuraea basaltis]TMR90439.1 hypothetical protein EJK15_55315 [Nonomuraea basaltis]
MLATPHRHRDDWAVYSCPHPSDVPAPLVAVHVEMYVTEEVQHQFAIKLRVPARAAGRPDTLHRYLDARDGDRMEGVDGGEAHPSVMERSLDTLYLLDAEGRRITRGSEPP